MSYSKINKKIIKEKSNVSLYQFRKNRQTNTKVYEAIDAVENGATEIDMVINISALKDQDYDYVKNEIINRFKKLEIESIDKWAIQYKQSMDELGVKELGEEKWSKEIAAQNQPAKVILRVNTLKTTKEALRAILMDLDIIVQIMFGW